MAVGTLSFVRTDQTEAAPPPLLVRGPIAWLRGNLFSSIGNTVLTILFVLLLAWILPPIVRFLFTDAVWSGVDRSACREDVIGRPVGACWAFVRDRLGYFTYGSYPVEERWRVDIFFVLMAFGTAWMLWLQAPARGLGAIYFFIVFPIASFVLLTGGHIPFRTFLFGWAADSPTFNLVDPLGPPRFTFFGLLLSPLYYLDFLLSCLLTVVVDLLLLLGSIFVIPLGFVGRLIHSRVEGLPGFWLDFAASALLVAAVAAALSRVFKSSTQVAFLGTLGGFSAIGVVLLGLSIDWGLTEVPTALWGGVLVTFVLSLVGVVLSLPLGVLLALGRRSRLPVVRFVCITFIEIVRGVPLITVLIMANAMLPLFLPLGWSVDRLMRPLIGVSLFAAAYMAEIVRGGLQAIPKGQYEGAMSLGLGYWRMMYFIVLPQALRIVIPGIVSTFIGLFKDTTLVQVVGLLDFVRTIEASRVDPIWAAPTVAITGYVFAGLFYWVCCFGMSRYSLMIERRLAAGQRR